MRPPPGLRRSAPHKLSARTPAHLDPRLAAALAGPLPTTVDLSRHPGYDQGQTSSCTAHALAKCVEIATGYRASMRDIYFEAGDLEHDTSDDGRELLDCLTVLRAFGAAPYAGPVEGRVSDVTEANASTPPYSPTLAARRRIDLGQATIDPHADNLSDLVVACLSLGAPIYLGTVIGDAFEVLAGATVAQPDPATDPDGGGHALALVGFRTMPDGSRQFRVQNSWGEAWDDAGECWASLAWVASCSELHVCLPPLSAAGERGAGLLDAVLVAVDRALLAGEHDVQAVVNAILARFA